MFSLFLMGTTQILLGQTAGTPWAWGADASGELGNGSNSDSRLPVQVLNLTGVITVAGGSEHSLSLKNGGTVWAWGLNNYGQLGNGTNNNSNVPVQVSNLTGVLAMAGGWGHSLALKTDGTAWGWGWNYDGEIGAGIWAYTSNVPLQVLNFTGGTAIVGGGWHTLALKNDGTAWAWGANGNGQLGDGTNSSRNAPVQVSNLTGLSAIAAGDHHSIAATSGASCSQPAGLSNNTAADANACAYTGVRVLWAADPSDWGDGGSGARTYDVKRDATTFASGLAYGTTAYLDTGGVNGTTYVYSVIYKNGCGETTPTAGASALDAAGVPGAPVITLITDESECAVTGIHINYTPGSGAVSHNLLMNGAVAVTGYASGALFAPGDSSSRTYQVQAVNTGGCTTNSAGSPFSDMNKNLSPPLILGVSDVNQCAGNGVKVFFNPGSGNVGGLTYSLVMDGTVVATNYTSGATFIPGDTLTHTFVVRIVSGYCASDSAPQPGTDVDNHLATAAIITSITDNDPCGAGILVNYTAAPGGVSHNLLKDGTVVVTGYTSAAIYNPGDTSSHTYVVQGVKGTCTLNSTGSSFSDVNNTPGAPVITSITDNDAYIQNGIKVVYTAGSGATSYILLKNGAVVVTGCTSNTTYNPGDSASHYYVIRAVHGTCTTDSGAMYATDAAGGGYPPPEAAPGDTSSNAQSWAGDKTTQSWPPVPGAASYTLYRGVPDDLPNLLTSAADSCTVYTGASTSATDSSSPATGRFYWYLVNTGNSAGEGPAGDATAGPRIINSTGTCPP